MLLDFCMSGSFRGLAPDAVRECIGALLATEVLGLGFKDAGVLYGEVHEVGERAPGETPPGERWPYELVAGGIEMKKLDREEALLSIDVADWGPEDRRGVGEPRDAPWPDIM